MVVTVWPTGYFLGLLLLIFTFPFDPQRHLPHRFLNWWCHFFVKCWPTWQAKVTGREKVPPGASVIIANHTSMADISAIMGLGVDFKFVAKAELFAVPGLGFMLRRLKYVPIHRGRVASASVMMEACKGLLAQGERLLIFPEGTYSNGPRRLPFRKGAFKLAMENQVPLVPVVIRGTGELVFEDGPWFEASSNVHIEVMDPIAPPRPDGDLDAFVKDVEAKYAAWLQGTAEAR